MKNYLWLKICSPLFVLTLWEVASRSNLVNSLFLPPPSSIFLAGVNGFVNQGLLWDLLISLFRLISGFVIGGVAALACALTMTLSVKLRWLLTPLISVTYPIPKSAFYPLLIIWLGAADLSKVVLITLATLFPSGYEHVGCPKRCARSACQSTPAT